MTFLRNLILASILMFSVLPLCSATTNPPQPATPNIHHSQVHHHHPHHIYYVYYRPSPATPWVCYGGYYNASQAHQAVLYFRSLGYDAYRFVR